MLCTLLVSLIFAILENFRVAGANEFFYPIGKKKVTFGPLLGQKTTKIVHLSHKIFSDIVGRKIRFYKLFLLGVKFDFTDAYP